LKNKYRKTYAITAYFLTFYKELILNIIVLSLKLKGFGK